MSTYLSKYKHALILISVYFSILKQLYPYGTCINCIIRVLILLFDVFVFLVLNRYRTAFMKMVNFSFTVTIFK